GFTTSIVPASRLAGVCTLLALVALAVLWRRSRFLCADSDFALRLFAAAVFFTMLCISHLKYDCLVLVYCFFIALAQKDRFPALSNNICLAVSFFVAYLMNQRIHTWWLVHVALPHNSAWLVPI